ncbi:MAG: site-2 protease family protein [Candidatus Omnitrophica bacterium]|nr:site-2 protease family protein [Candidatus Omnitrophota bacterium]
MLIDIILSVVIIFFSIILHECSHGWVAYLCGDPTAKWAGRLTLNPLKHIDPVGTVFLPGILLVLRFFGYHTFLFGWAKPVPVDFTRLRCPRRDMVLVGLAGPAMNIFLAFAVSRILLLGFSGPVVSWIGLAVYANLVLAVFNLLPIPPLDGSRLVTGLLPAPLARQYNQMAPYGIFIVVGLLYLNILDRVLWPVVDLLSSLLGVKAL